MLAYNSDWNLDEVLSWERYKLVNYLQILYFISCSCVLFLCTNNCLCFIIFSSVWQQAARPTFRLLRSMWSSVAIYWTDDSYWLVFNLISSWNKHSWLLVIVVFCALQRQVVKVGNYITKSPDIQRIMSSVSILHFTDLITFKTCSSLFRLCASDTLMNFFL